MEKAEVRGLCSRLDLAFYRLYSGEKSAANLPELDWQTCWALARAEAVKGHTNPGNTGMLRRIPALTS